MLDPMRDFGKRVSRLAAALWWLFIDSVAEPT
jgi:hypothetical protein